MKGILDPVLNMNCIVSFTNYQNWFVILLSRVHLDDSLKTNYSAQLSTPTLYYGTLVYFFALLPCLFKLGYFTELKKYNLHDIMTMTMAKLS